jgi:acyl carrier protein
VPQSGQTLSSAELHAFLMERLPEYMVPAAFVQLERMPLTSNGKIDRRALPDADLAKFSSKADCTQPRTPLEEEVLAAWQEVLGIERIGLNDNFFEIGGHSVLATRIIILLRSNLGLNISLRLLFENATVAGMATALMESLLEQAEQPDLAEMINEIEALSDEAAMHMREEIQQ